MLEMPRITKKINKKRFADDIAERTGMPKYKAMIFLEAFIEQFEEYLVDGETIGLRGLFSVGTKTIKGFECKNLRTQKNNIWIPERKKIKFNISEQLKNAVNVTIHYSSFFKSNTYG